MRMFGFAFSIEKSAAIFRLGGREIYRVKLDGVLPDAWSADGRLRFVNFHGDYFVLNFETLLPKLEWTFPRPVCASNLLVQQDAVYIYSENYAGVISLSAGAQRFYSMPQLSMPLNWLFKQRSVVYNVYWRRFYAYIAAMYATAISFSSRPGMPRYLSAVRALLYEIELSIGNTFENELEKLFGADEAAIVLTNTD